MPAKPRPLPGSAADAAATGVAPDMLDRTADPDAPDPGTAGATGHPTGTLPNRTAGAPDATSGGADETGGAAGPGSGATGSRSGRPPTSAAGPAHRPGLPARTTPPPAVDRAPLDQARRIAELAEDKKAADIVLLEIAPLTTVADYLVICSGGSERQLGAIADGIVEGLKHDGLPILGREGEPDSHWILIDEGAVIVHVFAPPEREYYALEKLWSEARTVLRVQ